MKGDKVEILLQVGDTVRQHSMVATDNGDQIVIDRPRGTALMDVIHEGRTGKEKARMTLRTDAVLAVIATPAPRSDTKKGKKAGA